MSGWVKLREADFKALQSLAGQLRREPAPSPAAWAASRLLDILTRVKPCQ